MLNDAHVPPFFYQDILLNWVKEGNQWNYIFCLTI
jgi:hypothetical protein